MVNKFQKIRLPYFQMKMKTGWFPTMLHAHIANSARVFLEIRVVHR
jgi:hypothetical protein